MSEEDVRGGLLDAVADEPPLRFDPDELVATARGQVRRRALVAAGLATVVVAVAAVAVPVALGRGTTTTPAADRPVPTYSSPSPSPSTARPTVQWPPPGIEPAHPSVADLRRRGKEMAAHLRATLPATLPSASDFTHGEFGGEAEGEFYPEQTAINAAISFTAGGARYSIVVTSWVRGGMTTPPEEGCSAACHPLGDRDGGVLFEQTEKHDQGVIQTVSHYRGTGAVVTVAAYNYDMTGVAPPVYQPTIPVTLDQLIAIATDPELEL